MRIPIYKVVPFMLGGLVLASSCKKNPGGSMTTHPTITVENVLDSKPMVETGTFQGTGSPALIMPGQSVSIHFSAAKGQAISFVTMYGWSNDLFFAPANPGIQVYDSNGNPIQGDVSSQVKLWDNGSRVNTTPGASVVHPGVARSKPVVEVVGKDVDGNSYLPASSLVHATLQYDGNSQFTLTLNNISGGTANQTPLSPGVWTISYIVGGQLLNADPFYMSGVLTTPALTAIAETGNNMPMDSTIESITGIFTPLSPILVVVYKGINNPIYQVGTLDAGIGLTLLAQKGNADTLAAALMKMPGVKSVYVLPAPKTTVLLPVIGEAAGSMVSQALTVSTGDRLAIATMYGFSNDWFFASMGNGVDPTITGDITSSIGLYDDGTAINQFPGAGITQFNLAGTPLDTSQTIKPVPNPNAFTTLPSIPNIIRVTLN
jgi:hypothetical protein